MVLYTIGFTQKSAQQFFELIKSNNMDMLVDIRLNNKSQLAGFAKGNDLRYFLEEICNCEYQHCIEYAPTKDILDSYKKKTISWDEYVRQYIPLMQKRNAVQKFAERFAKYMAVCLLCSEPTPEYCHRRLLSEMIVADYPAITVKHI
ncbi:DUF488 domain-containing protein [Acutalibacter muris]|uniref:DUF488 domain-containing protein n=1 Tax=Acutalibacter muris TaxID=1796620 RepID=UPI00272E000B|nr:DUF488 domain-containing protein [Acutalibacter muris]